MIRSKRVPRRVLKQLCPVEADNPRHALLTPQLLDQEIVHDHRVVGHHPADHDYDEPDVNDPDHAVDGVRLDRGGHMIVRCRELLVGTRMTPGARRDDVFGTDGRCRVGTG